MIATGLAARRVHCDPRASSRRGHQTTEHRDYASNALYVENALRMHASAGSVVAEVQYRTGMCTM